MQIKIILIVLLLFWPGGVESVDIILGWRSVWFRWHRCVLTVT